MLVGGLGMGFTLRATLDVLPPDATVVVAELVPAVVEWNRGPLGPLAGHPLKDRRVQVDVGDVAATLRASRQRFDAVLLDVDNGPAAFTASHNTRLYDDARSGRGARGAQGRRRAGGVVGLGGSTVRTALAPRRLHGPGGARPRTAEERAARGTRSSSVTYNRRFMLAFSVWMVLLTAALLVYPRRPRTAGVLIASMGVWTYLLRYLPWNNQRVNTGYWTAW